MLRVREGFARAEGARENLGQDSVECEALDGVSIDNWGWGAGRGQALARAFRARAGNPLAMLLAGCAAVAFAISVHMGSVQAPGLRAALETMLTLFALAAAWLLRVQFASSRRRSDLLLLAAALVLALTNFCVSALPAALDLGAGMYFPSAELWGQLAVGGILAAAALTPSDRLVVRSAHPLGIIALLGLAALAVAGLGGLVSEIPAQPATGGSPSYLADALARPLLVILVLGGTAPLAYAAVGFARRRHVEADRAATLLAAAAVLLAGASLSDLVTRSLAPGRIGADEAFRATAFSLILAAAVILERRVRGRLAKSAALAERRRVARDLHDGLAQDLAVIAAHGPSIAREMGDDHPVVVAARRALAISRSAISELTDPDGATAHESLEAVAQELRDRFAVTIAVDSQLDVDLEPTAREQVTRIAREAIANAVRHGRAQNVVVSLRPAERGVALRVVDDGCGIAPGDSGSVAEGFGLRSMRERAAALGGHMHIAPAERRGTELEVLLP